MPFSNIQDKHLKVLSDWYHEQMCSQSNKYRLPEGLSKVDLTKGYVLKNWHVTLEDCLSNNLISLNTKKTPKIFK